MTVLSIAICDDEAIALKEEEKIIKDILSEKEIEYTMKIFQHPQEMLNCNENYNIVFLDIEMNSMNGIELASKISASNKDCFIFFITNYSVYLDKAFDVNAFRFLSKPIDINRLSSGIDSAIERIYENSKILSIANYKNKVILNLEISNIIYIENDGRHARVVSTNYDFIAAETFSALKERIEKEVNYFAMSHQSYYVNLKYVVDYTKEKVFLSYANKSYDILMARRRYNEFDEKFFRIAKDIK